MPQRFDGAFAPFAGPVDEDGASAPSAKVTREPGQEERVTKVIGVEMEEEHGVGRWGSAYSATEPRLLKSLDGA